MSCIDTRALEVAKLITKEELLGENIDLEKFLSQDCRYLLRSYRNLILKENIDKDCNNIKVLLTDLAACNVAHHYDNEKEQT